MGSIASMRRYVYKARFGGVRNACTSGRRNRGRFDVLASRDPGQIEIERSGISIAAPGRAVARDAFITQQKQRLVISSCDSSKTESRRGGLSTAIPGALAALTERTSSKQGQGQVTPRLEHEANAFI